MAKPPISKLPVPTKGKLPGVPGVDPVSATTSAFSLLVEAYKDYNHIKQVETTKREMIRSQRDVAINRIQAQKEILQQYLQSTFAERASNFSNMFAILDRGIASGDDKQIGVAMNMIVKQMETNPLDGINQLMSSNVMDQIENPDIDCIEI